MNEPIIKFQNVDLGYGKRKILSNISFEIYPGEFIGIVGPNGSGKTTLLRTILNIIRPSKGEIFYSNNSKSIHFGYVPQQDTIVQIIPYTVKDVVMMGRYRKIGKFKTPGRKDKNIAWDSLVKVGIENLAALPFKELSGGQKQRTLIARAIASEPDVLVLDEPTNGMDLSSRSAILDIIRTLHKNSNRTIIMVSHLLNDVANFTEKIGLIENGLFQIGNVEEILSGTNLSNLYKVPVYVETIRGNKIIITGEKE